MYRPPFSGTTSSETFEDEGLVRRAVQVAQGHLHVDQAQHLVRLDLGVHVGALQVRVQGLAARGPVPYPEGPGVEGAQKGDERIPGPTGAGDELLDLEAPRRLPLLLQSDIL